MKLISVLFLTAVLAVSAVPTTSTSLQNILKRLLQEEASKDIVSQLLDEQLAIEEADVMHSETSNEVAGIQSTPTNVTAKIQSNENCLKMVGPYGGHGGQAFTSVPELCNEPIAEIVIRGGPFIDGIQLSFRKPNGKVVADPFYGGTHEPAEYVKLEEGENIVEIYGRNGALIDQIGFVTDKGRKFGPFGGSGGKSFSVKGCKLRGVTGRVGSNLDQIGFACGRPC